MEGVKEIRKGIEYDCYTDSIYDQPEYPHCEMPVFGIKLIKRGGDWRTFNGMRKMWIEIYCVR